MPRSDCARCVRYERELRRCAAPTRNRDLRRDAAALRHACRAPVERDTSVPAHTPTRHTMAVRSLSLIRLLRPHWTLLAVAFVAMLVQSAADLLEPWPLKVVFDYVLGSKPMPHWLAEWMPAATALGRAQRRRGGGHRHRRRRRRQLVHREVSLDDGRPSASATSCGTCSITTCSGCRCPSTSSGRPATWSSG